MHVCMNKQLNSNMWLYVAILAENKPACCSVQHNYRGMEMYDCTKFTAGFMNLANVATTMQVTGRNRLTALELNTASRIVSSVGVFTANSTHMYSHEKERRFCFNLFRSSELALFELRTLNSLCIMRPMLT